MPEGLLRWWCRFWWAWFWWIQESMGFQPVVSAAQRPEIIAPGGPCRVGQLMIDIAPISRGSAPGGPAGAITEDQGIPQPGRSKAALIGD